MDLSNLTASKTAVITLKHPVTGETLYCDDEQKEPMTWEVLAKHTSEFKKLASNMAKATKKKFGSKKLSELDEDELVEFNDMLTQLTIDTTTNITVFIDGKKPKFSRGLAESILSDEQYFWIKDQVTVGANDTVNFIKS